jgi:hypothetical protein
MKVNRNGHGIATTLGELIAMISDVAFEYSGDPKEAYHLSRLVLVEILKRASPKGAIVDWHFSTSKYLH